MIRIALARLVLLSIVAVALLAASASAATPSAEQALKLTPIQSGVDYDRPGATDVPKCKILAQKFDGRVGWIVEGPDGTILRKFVDTNGDNVVDQWSYYKDGVEVYRDIDANFNGKADQYRWFHTGGSRWGLDANEDGAIDSWKSLSAEETSAEVVAAMATRDAARFERLLLAPDELKSLGLGKSRADDVADKVSKAVAEFKSMAARQKTVGPDSVWMQFSANRPGVVPSGTDQSTKDVRVYENAMAIVESAGHQGQVQIGTLVQVGDVWRVIDLPQAAADGQAEAGPSGFFFHASITHRPDAAAGAPTDASQKLLADLEALDREAAKAESPEDQAKLTERRADLIEQIAAAAKTPDERGMWLRQLADMIVAAVQSGSYPEGAKRLGALVAKLDKTDKDLAGAMKFRQLTADYFLQMQAPKADYAKIQSEWLKTLEGFVGDYPTTADAAEAMLQLAMSQESSDEEGAKKWFGRIVKDFPDSAAGKKAAGALTRLDSVGATILLSGKSPMGAPVDLAKYRGKVVLIQFWATWSGPAKADMATLKELWNKYGRSFTLIGVNLDNDAKNLSAYLAENPLPWPQIREDGGLDSRPANALGILTVPTMILVDQQGKVVDRNVSIGDLESQLKKLVK
jgi:thiol-disulfide isomerase/thioredoxin